MHNFVAGVFTLVLWMLLAVIGWRAYQFIGIGTPDYLNAPVCFLVTLLCLAAAVIAAVSIHHVVTTYIYR